MTNAEARQAAVDALGEAEKALKAKTDVDSRTRICMEWRRIAEGYLNLTR